MSLPGREVFIAAAMDQTLKVYNFRLNIQDSLKWKLSAVFDMAYNTATEEIITASPSGV